MNVKLDKINTFTESKWTISTLIRFSSIETEPLKSSSQKILKHIPKYFFALKLYYINTITYKKNKVFPMSPLTSHKMNQQHQNLKLFISTSFLNVTRA